jgi:hypothetical protein
VTSLEESADPALESAIPPLKGLLSAMDADIGRLYAERGVAGVRPRFSMALIRLRHLGPMTVKQLAPDPRGRQQIDHPSAPGDDREPRA